MRSSLKINLDALGPDEEHAAFSVEGGVRVGSLLVSPQGLSASMGGHSYVISPADLTILTEREGGALGRGSSGAVWRAIDQRTGKYVAVKEIKVTSQAHLTEIRRELETLYDSSAQASPHMVDFYGAYTHEGSVFIAIECMDGTLAHLPRPVPLDVLAHITHSILRGLVYLHRLRHLIHRDLKPSNVLYSCATGDVKISDFGVSSNLECTKGDALSFVGTVTYMSPERLKGEHYSFAADMWSLGLLVAELATGAIPYPGLRSGTVEARFWSLLQHLNSNGGPVLELPATMDADLADFILSCVAKDAEARPTCTELLAHPFITRHCGPASDDAEVMDAADQADREMVKRWLETICERSHTCCCGDAWGSKARAAAAPAAAAGGADQPAQLASSGVEEMDGRDATHFPQAQGPGQSVCLTAHADTGTDAGWCPGGGSGLVPDGGTCSPLETSAGASAPSGNTVANGTALSSSLRYRHPGGSTDALEGGAGPHAVKDTLPPSTAPLLFVDCHGQCLTRASAEPSVNLDEELDKLLL